MTTTLEELTADDQLSLEHVARRIADWKQRIDDLYPRVAAWLAPEWSVASQRRNVRMLEEPMRRLGLDPEVLPVLDLIKDGKWALAFVPRALWIIGSNGDVGVTRPEHMVTTHFITDEAEHFEPPRWKIYAIDDPAIRLPLGRSSLRSIA